MSMSLSPSPSRQSRANDGVFLDPEVVAIYVQQRDLPPNEGAALLRYQSAIAGHDVLDMGVGAGRTTRFIAPLARRYECFDYAPAMVAWMRRHMPDISVRQCDARDLSPYADHSFDVVMASNCLFDAFDHADRLRALAEAARVLRPGGVLIFSAHNLRYRHARQVPGLKWSANPARTAFEALRWARYAFNYLRLRRHQQRAPDHAVLISPAHAFGLLLYFIDPQAQQAQLAAAGFDTLDMFDGDGRRVDLIPAVVDDSAWLYVARRRADPA